MLIYKQELEMVVLRDKAGTRRVLSVKVILLLVLIAVLSDIFVTSMAKANSNTFSWMSDAPIGHISDAASVPNQANCTNEKILVGSFATVADEVCVYQADGFRYGIIDKYITVWWGGYHDTNFVINFPGETRMYKVEGVPVSNLVWVPDSKDIITRQHVSWSTWGYYLYIIKDLRSKIRKVVNSDFSTSYTVVDNATEPLVKNENSDPVMTRSVGASDNGRWLAVELRPGGLLRIDMQNFAMKWFSGFQLTYGAGNSSTIEFAVSNDGKYVATVGLNADAHMMEIRDDCGRNITRFEEAWRDGALLENSCSNRDFYAIVSGIIGGDLQTVGKPRFNFDGGELTVQATPYYRPNVPFVEKWVTLSAPGYVAPKLEYLAMGDSYSSGEGDVGEKENGSPHYLSGTEQQGGCHLSKRSYPFLLRDYYRISTDKMHSVACSGAQVIFDYISSPSSYRGQRNQLENLNGAERIENQATALKSFKPGIIPQLEFVREYTPKIITVTGGGNDVGFANILSYCASPSWEGAFVDDTCGYAIEGSQLEKLLNDVINSQYSFNRLLITKIKTSSPGSKIILVGYPRFIASSSFLPCALNGGFLNGRERDMINGSVHKMNQMLRKVAYDSNISFVDIEDSLSGGRLCEGSEYMTGLHDLKIGDILSEKTAESFHPNHKGNAKIAETIQSSNLFNSDTAFGSGDYTPPASMLITQSQEIIKGGSVNRTDTGANLSATSYSFAANSSVTVTGYSDAIDLGILQASNDGSIQQYVDMRKLPIGRHVIVLSGISYSGEPIQYYQFIEAKESSTDSDGDGIPDTHDRCNYIEHWYDEETGEDVCLESTALIAKNQLDSSSVNSINGNPSHVRLGDGTIQAINGQSLGAQSENKNITSAIINKIKTAISPPITIVMVVSIILTVGTYGIISQIKKHQGQ